VTRIMLSELALDASQPLFQHRKRPCVERWKRSDHTCLALRDHELGTRYDEERRTDHGRAQAMFEEVTCNHGQRLLLELGVRRRATCPAVSNLICVSGTCDLGRGQTAFGFRRMGIAAGLTTGEAGRQRNASWHHSMQICS